MSRPDSAGDTERLRLHSGAPYWLLHSGLEEMSAPAGACDVAVIGAGITGALLADRLQEAGLKVTVFDRRAPATGSTAASTALLMYDIDVELRELEGSIGEQDAVRAYRLGEHAIRALEQLCQRLHDHCGFRRRQSIYLASRRRHRGRLERECAKRARHGFRCQWLDAGAVKERHGLPSYGALVSEIAAEVDPVRLVRQLLHQAVRRGAGLSMRNTVQHVEREGAGFVLTTSRGRFRADRVIFASGYEVPSHLQLEVALHSSYALVTEPVDVWGMWNDGSLVWESARPYCYMRSTSEGRVLIGGMDVPFRDADWRDRLMPDRTRHLEQRLAEWIPDIPLTTAFSWAGTFGETRDGLPYIGEHPSESGMAYALAYGGNGITFGVIAAEILTDWCLARKNDDARIFRLDR